MSFSDSRHDIIVRFRDGQGRLSVRDKESGALYEGPVEADEDGSLKLDTDELRTLPEEVQAKLRAMEVRMRAPARREPVGPPQSAPGRPGAAPDRPAPPGPGVPL